MKNYSPAIDGIPGIMPGTVQLPPPPIEIEEPQPAPHCKKDMYRAGESCSKPQHKIRMMPCNKEGKSFKPFKGRIWNLDSVFLIKKDSPLRESFILKYYKF